MKISVCLEAQLRKLAGSPELLLELPAETTLTMALQQVAESLGERAGVMLFGEQQQPDRGVLVFVNNQPVPASCVDSFVLSEGDQLLLIPPISGG